MLSTHLFPNDQPAAAVQPLVLFSIIEHHNRREADTTRVIGTLLGTKHADGTVDVSDSFPVPHTDNQNQVAVNTDFHETMLDLKLRTNPNLAVVGWYSTSKGELSDSSVLFHELYTTTCDEPLHLLLDLGAPERRMGLKGYISKPIALGETRLGVSFVEVKLSLADTEAGRLALDTLTRGAAGAADGQRQHAVAEGDAIEATVRKLVGILERISAYIDSVIKGAKAPDPSIVRMLQEAIASAPALPPRSVDQFVDAQTQDMLSIVYLANLTRAQLALAEKLQSVAPSAPPVASVSVPASS